MYTTIHQKKAEVTKKCIIVMLFFLNSYNSFAQKNSEINNIEIIYNDDAGYRNDRLNDEIFGLYDGTYFTSICLIFENSMAETHIEIDSRSNGKKEFDGILKQKNKNNISRMFFLSNNSILWIIKLDNRDIFIDDVTYRNYKFIVFKKINKCKIQIIYTNHVDYKFNSKQIPSGVKSDHKSIKSSN